MELVRLLCLATLVCSCARIVTDAGEPRPAAAGGPPSAGDFIASQGLADVPEVYRRAVEAFLAGEHLYRGGEYARCLELLERLWADYPPGGQGWADCSGFGWRTRTTPGTNVGLPPCYYALRMLTDCTRWRLAERSALARGARGPGRPTVTLTVVLAGRGKGVQPTTRAELEQGDGREVELAVHPDLLADGNRVIHESLWLFSEYVGAMTGGRLGLRSRVLHLAEVRVPLAARAAPHRFAGLGDGAWGTIWSAVPEDVRRTTDWWWVMYPSFVPGQYPEFETTEFITGGMGGGPDRGAPCFIIDDMWLVRKPPHLGKGRYTDIERRAYLPQWLQHEFFHHLFHRYREFGLEAKGHQWFDRKSWPEDFEGRFEPDYFHEALHRRLEAAEPPMHVKLRYTPPPSEVYRGVPVRSLVGSYTRLPVENDWHEGRIEATSRRQADGTPVLTWTNKAGVSWELMPDLARGVLGTGAGNPYRGSPAGRVFEIALRRGADGEWTRDVQGFIFNGELYARGPARGGPPARGVEGEGGP